MGLKAGIVGLPNVGKSTLFSGLTKMEAERANYAFTTINPNVSIVELNDPRLDHLAKLSQSEKVIKATFEFVDIAGLVAGASKGEGLGNQFLANIREVDLIVHVIRCFENKNIFHVANSVDAARDFEIINLELILADLQVLENVKQRIFKRAHNTQDKKLLAEVAIVEKLIETLSESKMLWELELNEEEKAIIKSYQLLTIKPMILVANVAAEAASNPDSQTHYLNLKAIAQSKNIPLISLSADMETEIAFISDPEERQLFLSEYNLETSGLDQLIRTAFDNLNLATYFTAGVKEARAWVFKKGMYANQCAGIIHNDFLKKFICAEVVSYQDFLTHGGLKQAKEAGKVRLEGKTYQLEDGDICNFKVGK